MEKNNTMVQLGISPELIKPVIETHIKAAIVEAFGGAEELIAKVVRNVLEQKVSANGTISNYSSDNRYQWLDIVITQQIRAAVEEEVRNQVKESSSAIREALVEELRSKAGAHKVAQALLDGAMGTFKHCWSSKMDISFDYEKV